MPSPSRQRHIGACAILLVCALPISTGAMGARAETLRARYSVSLVGLPIGIAYVVGTFSPTSYKIDANARLSGLASMISSSKGAATASGVISAGHVVPSAYATTAANSAETRTVRMAMVGGSVKGLDITPPFEARPGRVPLSDGDKRNIIDPMSALVMAVPGSDPLVGPAACNRTLPIFDGGTRFDVALSHVGTRLVNAQGYSGPVAVCAARYTPIAGHRPDRKATQFMAANKQMEIWLAPIAGTRLMVPFRIAVMTMIGMTVIEAAEFNVDQGTTSAAAPN